MQLVLYCQKNRRSHAAADVSRVREVADVRVLRQSGEGLLLVEFDGSPEDLRNLLGGLAGWAIDENRTYYLS